MAGVRTDNLYKTLADEVMRQKLRMFKPQNLSTIVWAFTKADVHADEVYMTVADEAMWQQLH